MAQQNLKTAQSRWGRTATCVVRTGAGFRRRHEQSSFTPVQLRYFEAAARNLSMTTASNELLVSQSAVSTGIAQLEKEVGGAQFLLRHHARGLSLTTAGEEFYKRVLDFLAHGAELVETARQSGTELVGTLAVGCSATRAPFRLPGIPT